MMIIMDMIAVIIIINLYFPREVNERSTKCRTCRGISGLSNARGTLISSHPPTPLPTLYPDFVLQHTDCQMRIISNNWRAKRTLCSRTFSAASPLAQIFIIIIRDYHPAWMSWATENLCD